MNYFIILVLIVLFIMLSNLRAENDKLRQDKEREQRHIDYSEYTQKQKQHEYLNELRIELIDKLILFFREYGRSKIIFGTFN